MRKLQATPSTSCERGFRVSRRTDNSSVAVSGRSLMRHLHSQSHACLPRSAGRSTAQVTSSNHTHPNSVWTEPNQRSGWTEPNQRSGSTRLH